MMDDRSAFEQRREFDGLGTAPPLATNDDASFAVPALIIAAMLIIGGYFVVSYNNDTVRTASNTPAAERTVPAPIPTSPPPATAPKQ